MTREFFSPLSQEIWEQKYRFKRNGVAVDKTLDDTFSRVAKAAASVEIDDHGSRRRWQQSFHKIMTDGHFLPGGRILAGAGTDRDITLFNCFVLGRIDDDLRAIFDALKEGALTMQAGGGIGYDFSTLRPRGATVHGVGAQASGPVSFMDVWDSMCATIMSAGQRRGAMMATLSCAHPDIEEFITAKTDATRLRNFNLSVLVTDAFIDAVKSDLAWPLRFGGQTYRTVGARALWTKITRANYESAEPGVIFIDRVNSTNNLAYCETISATNPCGEQPLPPYGACLLGSINLARLVENTFEPGACIDVEQLRAVTRVAVRLLDNIIDISRYPLPAQEGEAKSKRRIGLGVTGLADALIFVGSSYGSAEARRLAGLWMQTIQEAAYAASAELAAEKGVFPLYDAERFLDRPNVRGLSAPVREAIARNGVRNGCLTSIAPTGTISLLAGNVSSGIEPVFDFTYRRRIMGADSVRDTLVEDYAYAVFQKRFVGRPMEGPAWVRARDLSPRQHLEMQAALQVHVDSAISKTINCPAEIEFEAFETLYLDAYDLGLKGCTTFRPNAVTGSVLTAEPPVASPTVGDQGPLSKAWAANDAFDAARVTHAQSTVQPSRTPIPPETCTRCTSPRWRLDGRCRVCLDCGLSACG
jgi:ribonucleoside-diphosphate reductase alpha chain